MHPYLTCLLVTAATWSCGAEDAQDPTRTDLVPGDAESLGARDGGAPESCPPVGPFGAAPGDVVPDVELPDCDGRMHRLHSQCGAPLWIYAFAAWCPPCRRFSEDAQALFEAYEPQGLQAYFVVSETADYAPADAAFCAQTRDLLGLTMPVLYDPDGRLQSALEISPNAMNLVIDGRSRLHFKEKYVPAATMSEVLSAYLDPD